jgi:Ferritin-like
VLNEPKTTSRSDLFSMLSEACELEHGLACSYLFTAFTLKQDEAEGGVDWRQLQKVRLWAAQIYFVASEEMLHLAQVWNLLAAIGGTPYYQRPNFPQSSRYYPLGVALKLERFGLPAIDRFIAYELPTEVPAERVMMKTSGLTAGELRAGARETVGELYGRIARGLEAIPENELFIGDPAQQIGPELVHFPDIVEVTGRASALKAIETITEQGEGTQADRTDCHYGAFLNIRDEFEDERARAAAAGQTFEPARQVIENPVPRLRSDHAAGAVNVIQDAYTAAVAELFDAVYILMLRQLQYVFSDHPQRENELVQRFARSAIGLMPTVVKPLGEALALLPAGVDYGAQTAGPAFAMTRHVPLPSDPRVARIVNGERFAELAAEAERLTADARAPRQLVKAAENMKRMLH